MVQFPQYVRYHTVVSRNKYSTSAFVLLLIPPVARNEKYGVFLFFVTLLVVDILVVTPRVTT